MAAPFAPVELYNLFVSQRCMSFGDIVTEFELEYDTLHRSIILSSNDFFAAFST